jgi:hypothetical protein
MDKVKKNMHDIEIEYGVLIDTSSGRFNSQNGHFKVTVSSLNDSGIAVTQERSDMQNPSLCVRLGAITSWLDRKFINYNDGYTYVIVGLLRRSKKYPILAERVGTTRRTKFTSNAVKNMLQTTDDSGI